MFLHVLCEVMCIKLIFPVLLLDTTGNITKMALTKKTCPICIMVAMGWEI